MQSARLALTVSVARCAPSNHEILWPGIEEPLLSKHYSGRFSLPSLAFDFPWSSQTPAVKAHYWYVESEGDPEKDPIILWIQGGPGGSSIGGGFLEMGPLSLDDRSVATESYWETGIPTPIRNPFTWTSFAGLLMVDYADVGFSTCDIHKCKWDDATACNALANFLELFFTDLFPERAGRPLWIAGESYAGILVTVAAAVLERRSTVTLGGVLHGNGAVGHFTGGLGYDVWPLGFNTNDMPQDHRHHIDFFFRAGLVSEKIYMRVQTACNADWWRPSERCSAEMFKMQEAMGDFSVAGTYWNVYDIYDTCTDMPHRSRAKRRMLPRRHSARQPPEHSHMWYCGGHHATEKYMNLEIVRRAMHIPASVKKHWRPSENLDWNCSNDAEDAFMANFTTCQIQDYRPMIKDLAAKVPFLVYSGDADAQLPHTATERWTSDLGFDEVDGWQPWSVNGGYVAGYVIRYEHNFTYATVKGAGHMVPQYRNQACMELVERFIKSRRITANKAAEVTLEV